MMGNDANLLLVRQALEQGDCGQAVCAMDTYLTAWPEQQTIERLTQLREDYDRMVGYWCRGVSDPGREEQYRQLLQRMYVLYANVAHYHRMKKAPYLNSLYTRVRQGRRDWSLSAIRREMEDAVSSIALLQLEPEHTRQQKAETVYHDHQQQMNQLFEYVLTSRQWSDAVGSQFADMLTSPTIDTIDQQLIVSAVSLAVMNLFDMSKFRMLVEVYRRSQDEAVHQRALIGWVLALDDHITAVYPEVSELLDNLLQDDAVCRELAELQVQLMYCMNEEQDTQTIQSEIMPDLMNNNSFKITRQGIEEVDDDPLEDILHPDAADERMEKLEATFQRMIDMQKQGSDIYYGGFSQMKRFPFFYDISNWLVPFYLQHPDVSQQVKQLAGNKFIEKIIATGPFCNSDKYSFLIAFQQVMDRLPESMREMLRRGEATLAGGLGNEEELQSPAYIRRLYLMDLYRFFRLFSHRSELLNPFDRDGLCPCFFFHLNLFCGTPLDAHKRDIVRLLKKHRYTDEADRLLATFPASMHDVQYFLWTGDYDKVLEQDPTNERALRSRVRRLYQDGRYEEALAGYDQLMQQHPDKVLYQLNVAVCLLSLKRYEEALKLLYRLNYEQPDDVGVSRVLAWTLTSAGRLEQAEKAYQQLTAGEQSDREDQINYGYCLWLQGRIEEAAEHLKGCADLDEEWLSEHGISAVEIKMMRTLANR